MSANVNILDTSMSAKKKVLLLAWPATLEQILMTLVNYVDTAMVGSMGVHAAASVTINTTFMWLINGFMFSVATGFSVLVAQAVGENNREKVKETLRQTAIGMIAVGLFLMCVIEIMAPRFAGMLHAEEAIIPDARTYLMIIGFGMPFQTALSFSSSAVRGMGNTRTPMLCNISFNIVNVIANFLLIYPKGTAEIAGITVKTFGLGLGVKGAALGTAIGAVFAGILMTVQLFRKASYEHISVRDKFRPKKDILKSVTVISVPLVFERVSVSFGQIIGTGLATGLSTASLTAHQLANTAESICYMPANGFGVAVTTLVAQAKGAKKDDMAREYGRICMAFDIGVMAIMATLMFIFAPQLMGVFIKDEAVITTGARLLRIEAFVEPCLAINGIGTGIMKGERNTKIPFRIALVGMWIIGIPLSFVLIKVMHMGVEALWLAMCADWTTRAILNIVYLKKSKSL